MGNKCPECQHENPDDTLYCGKCATPLGAAETSSVTRTLITRTEKLKKGSTVAGKYQILEQLGRGGMGVVYKGEDTKLKRTVALKFLPPELTHIPEVQERFMREARAAAALDHPNICTVYEFGEAEDTSFISMAYIEGQNLKKKIEPGPLALDEALGIATQIAEGLQEAHKKGIVHRDIKSSNIMVTEDNQAKIMDFGLARVSGGTLITKEGSTMGTVAYMSPEQARGEEVDHRTDIWSFGVVLYEMFTGQLPFKGEHDQGVVYSILNEKPKLISSLCPEIPVSIAQVVSKSLEKNPDERYQQVTELLDDLKLISAGIVPDEIKIRLRKIKQRRRKKATYYAGASGLIIIMGVIALSLFPRRAEAISSIAVLPLRNQTGNPEQEYFVDGATDELIGQLAKIGAWNVISRTTAMRYKGADKPLSEIAQELKVDAVVEGTVYQIGDKVRIRVQLFDVLPKEQNLWAEVYNRPMSEVLVMYSEMARAIADKTKVNLTADELTRLTSASHVNPESYDNYLKGKSHWYKFTPQELRLALQYFELAVKTDPNSALAQVGVGMAWGGIFQMGGPFEESFPPTKAAIEKALELDNTLAEAHYMMAGIRWWGEGDWESAETEYQQALKLNPNFPDARAYYSHLLANVGRANEGLPYIERALKLDPLNPLFYGLYGVVLVYQHRFDEALAAARTALDMVPGHPIGRFAYQQALISKGMRDELLAYQRQTYSPAIVAALEQGLEEGGYESALRATADLLAERYGMPGSRVRAWDIARRYVEAGDYDVAMDWLEKAYGDHEPNLPYISMPANDPLHKYPRFKDLLRRIGLPVKE